MNFILKNRRTLSLAVSFIMMLLFITNLSTLKVQADSSKNFIYDEATETLTILYV